MINVDLSNTILCTHKNCLDGSSCAVVFLIAGGKKENIRFSSPSHNDTDALVSSLVETHSGPIILADISISENLAKSITKNDIWLFDHHKSAECLKNISWCEIDNSRCGSKIFYHWLLHNFYSWNLAKHEPYINLVDDHDLWLKNEPDSDKLALLHGTLDREKFIKRFSNVSKSPVEFFNEENYLIDNELSKMKDFIDKKKKEVFVIEKNVEGNKLKFGFVLADKYQSELGHAICEDLQLNVDVTVMLGQTISMRSSKRCSVDLSKIAERWGGGGHKSASGLPYDKILGKSLKDIVIERLV